VQLECWINGDETINEFKHSKHTYRASGPPIDLS